MLARLFVFFGGLLVLALTAALVGPYFIDWTNYRAKFEREASVILGRQVTVEGAATARLLPFPSVTFSDVSVAGGARVYVLPWSPDYGRVRVSKSRGGRWFCSEQEAIAAGWERG